MELKNKIIKPMTPNIGTTFLCDTAILFTINFIRRKSDNIITVRGALTTHDPSVQVGAKKVETAAAINITGIAINLVTSGIESKRSEIMRGKE